MIPLKNHRTLEVKGAQGEAVFGLSAGDEAHIMGILRDTLYSDKILAVLREYASNAWDAHRSAGKADVPIRVKLPTWTDLDLEIQDYGPGLSHEDVFEVFTQYGASTKRDSNDMVGALGIGSKSGFAYTDSFTIVSRHGGKKRTYVAHLDDSEKGAITLLATEDCPADETGLMIQIATSVNDIPAFTSRAEHLFQHFNPYPDINLELKLPEREEDHVYESPKGVLYSTRNHTGWTVVMGCVPYPLNLSMFSRLDGSNGLPSGLASTSGLIHCDIGEVEVSASREALKYSDTTLDALRKRLNTFFQEVLEVYEARIEASESPWEKRRLATTLHRNGIPLPPDLQELTYAARLHREEDTCFTSVDFRRRHITAVTPLRKVRLVLRDVRNSLRRYPDLRASDQWNAEQDAVIIALKERKTWDDFHAEIEELGLTGIPMVKLSELPCDPPPPRSGSRRYRHRSFLLASTEANPLSGNWETVEREPTDDDVYVLLEHFQAKGRHNFYGQRRNDQRVAEELGLELPKVYGYRDTDANPVDEKLLKGTPYGVWREEFFKEILARKEVKERINRLAWSQAKPYAYAPFKPDTELHALSKNHPLREYRAQLIDPQNDRAGVYSFETRALLEAAETYLKEEEVLEEVRQRKYLEKRYPLLRRYTVQSVFEDPSTWIHYIQLMDGHHDD